MVLPERKVFVPEDIEKWEKSEAYQDILGFITAMNTSVKGKKLSDSCVVSEATENICKMLDIISDWIDDIPPIEQPQRYGNKAFREFYSKLMENSSSLLEQYLPDTFHSHIPEITPYLTESFGNSTRIDYGTGHELAFIMFLCCLHKIEFVKKEDSVATVTKIFKRYLDLARKLQTVYKMEPAGSQGVWSLDDYQFMPFMWGSSQLMMNPKIAPEMFTQEKVVQEYSKDYLFLGCIEYIMSVKTGPFAEHSNQLWNISAVQSWTKVNQGLMKMYKAEILHKFPIIQHVLFGSLLSIDPAKQILFHPPSDPSALKGSFGMSQIGQSMGMMASTSAGMMPPMHGRMPLLDDVMPPFQGRMPPPYDVMPPTQQGRMPPTDDIMPPPPPGRMPTH